MLDSSSNIPPDDRQKIGMEAVREKVESLAWLAQRMGVTRGALTHWSDKIPAERVGEISRLTGLAPNILRPDIFEPVTPPAE